MSKTALCNLISANHSLRISGIRLMKLCVSCESLYNTKQYIFSKFGIIREWNENLLYHVVHFTDKAAQHPSIAAAERLTINCILSKKLLKLTLLHSHLKSEAMFYGTGNNATMRDNRIAFCVSSVFTSLCSRAPILVFSAVMYST